MCYNDLIREGNGGMAVGKGSREPGTRPEREDGGRHMRFRTRLRVTFIVIIVLPLILTAAAFCGIGLYLTSAHQGFPVVRLDYTTMTENMREVAHATDDVFFTLKKQIEEDSSRLADIGYLEMVNSRISHKTTYILVRKEDSLYYAGNEEAAEAIFPELPGFQEQDRTEGSGIYYDELDKFVKQLDFYFPDGSKGSAFVVTKVNTLISRKLLVDMFVAIFLILIFTSIVLTRWIHKGVFNPINELNIAMRKIKEGNFDYVLETDAKGEIGDLYRNYEDMRLRLKETTEENRQSERQNRELVSNISHDLKTPITAIKGYVEGIMDGVADTPEKQDKYIRTIYNKANEMDKLIDELTLYSNIDTNRIPYNFNRINVADYFDDCVDEVGLDLESKNIKLTYIDYADKDVLIIADPEQLRRVIHNIIGNSIKYLDKPQGFISIRIRDVGDFIQVEIEDNGKGIAAKDLPYIFDRFYRTDESRNSSTGGSGIGLSIVKKIIEDHGGKIWANSKEGTGTIMYFVIRKYQEVAN